MHMGHRGLAHILPWRAGKPSAIGDRERDRSYWPVGLSPVEALACLTAKTHSDFLIVRKPKATRVLYEMSFDRFFIPFEPRAGNVGYVQEPILDVVRRLQNGVRPILPFQPMRSFSDAHHV